MAVGLVLACIEEWTESEKLLDGVQAVAPHRAPFRTTNQPQPFRGKPRQSSRSARSTNFGRP